MSKQFTPCPACGAVGEVNSTCQFCGTTILLKDGAVPSDARIVEYRTVTPQLYAERISIYKKVEKSRLSSKLMYVSIGDEKGIINLNGELVYPLQHNDEFDIVSDSFIASNETLINLKTLEKRTNLIKLRADLYRISDTNNYIIIENDTICDLFKNIELNHELLAEIKTYLHKVKINPNYNKFLRINFNEQQPFCGIMNNTFSGKDVVTPGLTDDPGVSLCVSENYATEEQYESFRFDKIYYLFYRLVEDDEGELYETNFEYIRHCSFDVEFICYVIQYLAELYESPSEKIVLEELEWDTSECDDSSESDNSQSNETISIKTQWIIAIIGLIIYALIKFLG